MQNRILTHPLRRASTFLVVGLLAGLWLAPLTYAQGGGFSPERMQERLAAQTEDTIKQLTLADDQKEPVRTILEEHNKKRMDMMAEARESGGGFGGMREMMATLAEETETKLAEVLTKEQMATYKKIQEALASQRGRRGGRRQGGVQ